MPPRVLFVAPDADDYLADSLLHGLRSLLGEDVIDFPRCDALYADTAGRTRRYGRGFTLYGGLLADVPVDRTWIRERVAAKEFDLVVIGDIWRRFGIFAELLGALDGVRCAVLDGADHPAPYPYAPEFWRRRGWRTLPRAHTRAAYFKRELTPETRSWRSFGLVPPALARRLPPPGAMRPISFSIPEEKIVAAPPAKTKRFPAHVVDDEVAARLGDRSTGHVFDDEAEYYADLRAARYGITTKREGWDAMRHYELAANGCVPCFRDLDRKPATCAPHGLDAGNCVVYHDADELFARLDRMGDDEYAALQGGALAWAREHSTRAEAERFLVAMGLAA